MKQGWEIKKLGEICHTSNGLWKGKKPPFITIGVLRSTNFTKDCRLKLDDVAYIEVEEKSFAKRQLQRNDIVVERSGGGLNQPVGRVLLFDIDDGNFSFCNFTSALRVIDSAYISPIYLHKYLSYFYLLVKNPNKVEIVDERTPQEIAEKIKTLNEDSQILLDEIMKVL